MMVSETEDRVLTKECRDEVKLLALSTEKVWRSGDTPVAIYTTPKAAAGKLLECARDLVEAANKADKEFKVVDNWEAVMKEAAIIGTLLAQLNAGAYQAIEAIRDRAYDAMDFEEMPKPKEEQDDAKA